MQVHAHVHTCVVLHLVTTESFQELLVSCG